jgi:hypothetical protein
MELPVCCGKQMEIKLELGRFVEVRCPKCGDIVYVKKYKEERPVLIDD